MNKIYYSRLHLPDVSQAESEIRQLFPMSDEHPIQDFGSNGSGELFTGGALDKIVVAEKIMGPAAKKIRDQCYKREVIPKFISGDVLIYRLDTWHRGTPVKHGKVRYTHNLLYKRVSNSDIQNWNPGITRAMYSGKLERFIGGAGTGQLEVLGFPPRDSEKSSKFCKAIRTRYSWGGLYLEKYIQTPPEPGPVPQFWSFTNFTFVGEDPQALRETLFEKLRAGSTQIFIKNSNWTYKLYLTDGPHYLVIDLHFFKRADGSMIAELNLLSGDRMTFGNLWNHITGKRVVLRDKNYWPSKTPTYVLNAIKSKAIEDSMVTMVGNDIGPEAFLPFMRSPDLNVVRIAMERFSGTKISDEITEWAQRIPRNFLEKKITERATELCEISSRL